MEWWLVGILLLSLVLVFVFIGVPVAVSLGLASVTFLVLITGLNGALTVLHTELYDFWTSWGLLPIPLFILMGELLFVGGQAEDIFDMASKWLSRLPGGLAVTTSGAAAIFSTMTGSSLGTTATFSLLAVPQMLRKGYSPRLACGSVCAAGGLAHLIPPSIIMVVYCTLLDLSIGEMFMAGVGPGIVLASGYILVAVIWALRYPESAPTEEKVSWLERILVLRKAWSPLVIIMAVMGTIYTGIATVTEAAALGAFTAFLIALFSGKLTWKAFVHVVAETVKLNCFILFIAVAGKLLSWVLTYYLIPQSLVKILISADLDRYMIIVMMMITYIFMGMFIDAIGIIVISMPIMYPILIALGFSPIWFGILLFINIEMALITPPLGLNLYIVQGVASEIPLKDIMLGAFVFAIADMSILALVIIFPEIALWLPNLIYN
ncbi:MAG: TRAP transporter large permease subunit [Deltaproteobacteria bacterium]|nr:MAG: TRAP transporter large permease subunit [Deltaproteobacteria bacterium]